MDVNSTDVIPSAVLVRIPLIRRFPQSSPFAVGVLLVSAIAVLDSVTGSEVSVALLYAIAISTVTWLGSRRDGVLVSGFTAAQGFVTDAVAGGGFGTMMAWDAATRLAVLSLIALLIGVVRDSLMEQRNRAMIDTLTGAMNRGPFFVVAEGERLRAGRTGSPITAVYFDLDLFKAVNDNLGHETGDRVLQIFADSVRAGVRGSDILCRMGGDEFALILPDTDAREAVIVVDRVRQILANCSRSEMVPITASVGIATYRFPPATVDAMISGADELMYRAKDRGGNTVVGNVFGGSVTHWSDQVAKTEQAMEWV